VTTVPKSGFGGGVMSTLPALAEAAKPIAAPMPAMKMRNGVLPVAFMISPIEDEYFSASLLFKSGWDIASGN
jgi:hypothetical protein